MVGMVGGKKNVANSILQLFFIFFFFLSSSTDVIREREREVGKKNKEEREGLRSTVYVQMSQDQ